MNPDALLYRMVHSAYVQGDTITSQVFRPPDMDLGLLSVYDGSKITPENAWECFTNAVPASGSYTGIVGVTVAECQRLELPVTSSGSSSDKRATIDFTGLTRSRSRRKADLLRRYAMSRGWLFRS